MPEKGNESQQPRAARPYMPGYGLPPAEGQDLLPWAHVDERMARSRNYWICTTRPDGRPHATPVWGLWSEGGFYFAVGSSSRKHHNLAVNPSLAVHLESGDDVVILEGLAEETTDPALLARLDAAYQAKYGLSLLEAGGAGNPIYGLRPRIALAWLEDDFVASATRWEFPERA
jgi:hypothetical protein